jgi:hypothetical protein
MTNDGSSRKGQGFIAAATATAMLGIGGAAKYGDNVINSLRGGGDNVVVTPRLPELPSLPQTPRVPELPRVPVDPPPTVPPYRPPRAVSLPPRPRQSTISELSAAVDTWVTEHPTTRNEAKEVIGGLICDIFISIADGEGFPDADELLASQAISSAYPSFSQRRQAAIAFARLRAMRMRTNFNLERADRDFAAGEVCSYVLTP